MRQSYGRKRTSYGMIPEQDGCTVLYCTVQYCNCYGTVQYGNLQSVAKKTGVTVKQGFILIGFNYLVLCAESSKPLI